jgi:hypothetical protein
MATVVIQRLPSHPDAAQMLLLNFVDSERGVHALTTATAEGSSKGLRTPISSQELRNIEVNAVVDKPEVTTRSRTCLLN